MMIVALVRIARLARVVTRSDPKRFSPIFATDLAPARHDGNDILEPCNLFFTRLPWKAWRRALWTPLAQGSLVGIVNVSHVTA